MSLQAILNLLKKMRKYFFVGFILLLVIVLVLLLNVKKKEVRLAVKEEAINLFVEEDKNIDFVVLVYVNQNDAFICDINNIKNSYLENARSKEIFSVFVNDLEIGNEVKIGKEKYYELFITLNSNIDYDLYYDDCYLVINYNEKNIRFKIGKLSILHYDKLINDDLEINYIRGLTQVINGKSILTGIYLGVNAKEGVIINDISFSDYGVIVRDIKQINDFDEEEVYIEINSLKRQEKIFNDLSINGEAKFLLLLGYQELEQISEVGIKIDYTRNNTPKIMFYPKFRFFIDHNNSIYLSDLVFYEFSND